MHGVRHWAALALVLIAAGLFAYGGYRVLWFQTDDAFITFRYASNAMAGRGYVWNPPPFRPVEGYTSPAWLFLLHAVWWATSIEPPESSAWLGLCFGWVTLVIVAAAVLRARFLAEASPAYRVTVVAFVLLGTVTNRTFLTWLSSGLETSFFDAAVAAWIFAMLALGDGPNPRRAFRASAAATLVALARPDGYSMSSLRRCCCSGGSAGTSRGSSLALPERRHHRHFRAERLGRREKSDSEARSRATARARARPEPGVRRVLPPEFPLHTARVRHRPRTKLTDDEIRACEARFARVVAHGR